MEQLWLAFSVLSVVTGFVLLVAVVFMMRLAPTVSPPPVLPVLAAFLLMGFASVGGVYLRVLDIERSVTGYRMVMRRRGRRGPGRTAAMGRCLRHYPAVRVTGRSLRSSTSQRAPWIRTCARFSGSAVSSPECNSAGRSASMAHRL